MNAADIVIVLTKREKIRICVERATFCTVGNARKKRCVQNQLTMVKVLKTTSPDQDKTGLHIYENWVSYESGVIKPRTGKRFAKPATNSFLFDHQKKEDHNGDPHKF